MKVSKLLRIVSFLLCFVLTFAYCHPAQAAPSKDAFDNYAKSNGFPRSDYPYYENVNACGGNDWSERGIRDSWGKVSFREACDNHDRCFMTIGSNNNACDDKFYEDLRASCERDSYIRDPLTNIKLPDPVTLAECYRIATAYYGGVRIFSSEKYQSAQEKAKRYEALLQNFANSAVRVTICNRISSTATFFLNSELKSMESGKCGGYTLAAGSTFKTSYTKDGRRIQVLVNLEGVTYDLVKYPSGDIELKRK